jgi:hypothetical protein
MRIAITAALGAAIVLSAPAAAAQAETVRYRVTLDVAGSWSESVRANPDAYPPAQVATRDSALRWSLRATARDVAFRDGRVATPVYPVLDTSVGQEVLGSTFTDFDGEAGSCRADTAVATGGGAIASVGASTLLRPSSDAPLDLQCATPHVRYAITVDLLRNAGSNEVPELGQGPLDAAFAFPAGRFGAARVAVPVSVAPAQRAFDRCPRQDPNHTTACGFDWSGQVLLERLSPRIGAARLARDGRSAAVPVTCFERCTVKLRSGRAAKSFRLGAGATGTLRLRLDARTRRTLAGGGAARLTVRSGADGRTLRLR